MLYVECYITLYHTSTNSYSGIFWYYIVILYRGNLYYYFPTLDKMGILLFFRSKCTDKTYTVYRPSILSSYALGVIAYCESNFGKTFIQCLRDGLSTCLTSDELTGFREQRRQHIIDNHSFENRHGEGIYFCILYYTYLYYIFLFHTFA